MLYDIQFNGRTGTTVGVIVQNRPNIPAPKKIYDAIELPGKDGVLYRDTGTVEDIRIEVPLAFREKDPSKWSQKLRSVKEWLLSVTDNKLSFTDDSDYFYRVKKVTVGTTERYVKRQGRLVADFCCNGYMYLKSGAREQQLDALLDNPGIRCLPVYKISGNGMCTITINGKQMKANVGQNLTIDTERKLAYRTDGSVKNTSISGDYEDIALNPGRNSISVTSGFALTAIPNWRCY